MYYWDRQFLRFMIFLIFYEKSKISKKNGHSYRDPNRTISVEFHNKYSYPVTIPRHTIEIRN